MLAICEAERKPCTHPSQHTAGTPPVNCRQNMYAQEVRQEVQQRTLLTPLLRQCSAGDAAGALDDVQDTWRQPCLQRQLADAQRAERGLLCNLAAPHNSALEDSKRVTHDQLFDCLRWVCAYFSYALQVVRHN